MTMPESDERFGPGEDELNPESQRLLEQLGAVFMEATRRIQRGEVARGAELLQMIVRRAPRLPEPHLELARIHYDAGQLGEAEAEAREALRYLEQGGQWVDEIPEDVMLSLAHGLLGEILKSRLDDDTVVFGDPTVYSGLLEESRRHFDAAARLDPQNDHAGHHAFFLGLDDLGLDPDAPPLDGAGSGEQD